MTRSLTQVEMAARAEIESGERLRRKVKSARRQGATWKEIAAAIGKSLSATHGRFRNVDAEIAAEEQS